MMDATTNEVCIIDFGTALVLSEGVTTKDDERYGWRNPFNFGPEAYLGQPVSFNADVFMLANHFGEFFSENGSHSVF